MKGTLGVTVVVGSCHWDDPDSLNLSQLGTSVVSPGPQTGEGVCGRGTLAALKYLSANGDTPRLGPRDRVSGGWFDPDALLGDPRRTHKDGGLS